MTIVEEEQLLRNVRERGAELRAGLEKLARKFDFIRTIRGEGLMVGLELAVDGNEYVRQALQHGLVINCTHDRVLRLLPAFVVKSSQIQEFLQKLEVVLAKTPRPKETSQSMPQTADGKTQAMAAAGTR
jgi:acetylornithine/succinyldiaminopimelate/putrescine aminotransferase